MALTEREIRKIAEKIVSQAKTTANYDQGTLFRSISYTFIRGVLVFRQIFYGQYNDNSQLEKLARRYVPNGTSYRIILTDINRRVINTSRIKQGTRAQKSLTGLLSSTVNIRNLINRNKNKADGDT